MYKKWLIFIFILSWALIGRTQESRIALVIGNSDYVNFPPLKNPVNDAELISSSLSSLGFEVVMANNLKTQRQFLDTIRSFQRKSAVYNVRFIYYAGHAVQIGEENYLLPTAENYQNSTDYTDYAIPLITITKEFRKSENINNVINVVIIDACRENPFKNISDSRGVIIESLYKERSTQEVLISYATTSGATASDGLMANKNSVFCSSLVKNMMLPDIPFEDVLKMVRVDVKKALNQKPEYLNSLDCQLYLKRSTYTDQIKEIDSLITANNFDLAKEKTTEILTKAPNNKLALLRRGKIEYITKKAAYDGAHLLRADSLYPNDPTVNEYLSKYYAAIGKNDEAISKISYAIKLDEGNPSYFSLRARINTSQNKLDDAIIDFNKAIEIDEFNGEWYNERADFYLEVKKDYNNALLDYSKAIELDVNNVDYLYARGLLFTDYLKNNNKAIADFEKILQINPENIDAINAIGAILEKEKKLELALAQYEKGIALEKSNPKSAAYCYINRARVFTRQNKLEDALKDYNKATEIDEYNGEWYYERANFYLDVKKDYNNALIDYSKAIELDVSNVDYLYARGLLFADYLKNNNKAIADFEMILQINPENIDAINSLGTILEEEKKLELALAQYEKGIALGKSNPKSAAYCYSNRARVFTRQNKLEDALKDYNKATEIDEYNGEWYYERANFYLNVIKDYNNALIDYSKAIEIDSANLDYLYERGILYSNYFKNNNKAIADFEKILQINPEDVDAINALGAIFEEENKFELAIAQYEKGIALEKSNPRAAAYCYINRSRIFKGQNKLNDALKDYNKAIEIDGNNSRWYFERAKFYNEILNNALAALADYSIAISLDTTEINYLWKRGKLFSDKLDNQQLAIQDFDKILTIDPNNINALNWQTIFYDRMNEVEKAIKGYKKIISLADSIKKTEDIIEDYGWANINLALIYQCEGPTEEPLKLYNEAIAYMPTFPEFYYWRAWFFALYTFNSEAAINDISIAIKLEPDNPYWLLNRSKIYLLKGDLINAQNDIDKALKISNKDEIFYAERGNYFSLIGEFEKAKKDFKQAEKINPKNRRLSQYITEDMIRQGKWDEAIINAELACKTYKNDTVSYEQLGRVYFFKNDLQKALNAYTHSAAIMDFNESDKTIYPDEVQVNLSDIYLRISELYKLLNQSDLGCEAIKNANSIVVYETRPDRQKLIREIKEKLRNCPN